MSRMRLLNPAQLEVLGWVRDGAPGGAYMDYRPRIIARALHHRGLVEVTGRGEKWKAAVTEDGASYLANHTYPFVSDLPVSTTLSAKPRIEPAMSGLSRAEAEPRPRKTPRVGPTDAMMNALTAAEDHRIEIEYDQLKRYRQLVLSAERFKKVPDGLQITINSNYRTRTATVILHPMPEWRTRVLVPVPVPAVLRDPTNVVQALQDRNDFDIRAAEKKRALRLVQALVLEARQRDYVVSAVRVMAKDRWGYLQRTEENTKHFKIKLSPDEYRLSIYQLADKREHAATKSELSRAGRGWALPKWDFLPTGKLGIRIDTTGASFWGQSWTDHDDRPLEDQLAQILQELELRHDAAADRRLNEERQRLERKRQWEAAREGAVQALTDSHRAEILMDQVARWRQVAAIRDYADDVERQAKISLDDGNRARALEWVQWARDHADNNDPLQQAVELPTPQEPTPAALQPFMGSWSPYAPS